jgi:catechol 2,3-dioxygenase-like lactoylglutathione lyase family enzyme
MDRAVAFYRDVIGLELKFQSPGWSEFTENFRGAAGCAAARIVSENFTPVTFKTDHRRGWPKPVPPRTLVFLKGNAK